MQASRTKPPRRCQRKPRKSLNQHQLRLWASCTVRRFVGSVARHADIDLLDRAAGVLLFVVANERRAIDTP